MSSSPPAKRRRWVLLAALQIQKIYDAFHRFLAKITGRLGKPMAAEMYFAVQHDTCVSLKGRVLLARKWRHPHVNDHPLFNLWQMVRRWATPERPFSLVRASAGGAAFEERADRQGYFEIDIPLEEVKSGEAYIELPESGNSEPSHWEINRPGNSASCIIISDVDDTVLVTDVAKMLKMIATTLFGNALTRQLFPGTSALYQALQHGPDPSTDQSNILAYVTSSPYNLHGLLYLIFKENQLPVGPFFMTDWGLAEDQWLSRSHRDHKVDSIRQVIAWHPGRPVVLIGDSGQKDTAIYIETALEFPGVISEILIRNVTDDSRIEELMTEVERLEGTGTRLDFFKDSGEAAAILTERGYLSPAQRDRIQAIVHEPQPTLIDRVTKGTKFDPKGV